MARKYVRDKAGRFASTGSAGRRPAAKAAPRGKNLLTRDNSGKITSKGGSGATARGGRLKTASGKLRAVQTAKIKGGPGKFRTGKSAAPAKVVAKPNTLGVKKSRPALKLNTANANSQGLPGRPRPRVIGANAQLSAPAKTKKGRRVVQSAASRQTFVRLASGDYAITTSRFAPDVRGRRTTETVQATPAQAKARYKRARTWQGLNGKSPRARRVM